jgi:hypothetical protein
LFNAIQPTEKFEGRGGKTASEMSRPDSLLPPTVVVDEPVYPSNTSRHDVQAIPYYASSEPQPPQEVYYVEAPMPQGLRDCFLIVQGIIQILCKMEDTIRMEESMRRMEMEVMLVIPVRCISNRISRKERFKSMSYEYLRVKSKFSFSLKFLSLHNLTVFF